MAILPLSDYVRRYLTQGSQLAFHTTKGTKIIAPGMIFGLRLSHDRRKMRCIIEDEINKVFTLTGEDYQYLLDNSISIPEAIEEGYLTEDKLTIYD